MICPNCKTEIPDTLIKQHSARLAGRKSRRILTPEQARKMQKKGVENREKKRAKGAK